MRTRLFTYAIGLAATLAILGLIVATRILAEAGRPEVVVLQEVEVIDASQLPPPPPPPPPENPADQPPPPVALPELQITQDLAMPALPVADVPLDPRLSVDTFALDASVAELPAEAPPKVVAKPAPRPVNPAPVVRPDAPMSLKQLDGKPRLIFSPKVRFPLDAPRSMRSGQVLVRVIIDTNGKSSLHSVVRSSHPAFVDAAKRIANGARFTPPQAGGKKVKAIMLWPITINR
ncbi:TonB family protein [Sulfuriroseicoccus oceanibius]|uniref:TonB family protein n=1 Tax=Sulfuriroseicoccus oceanibius TaxID=2707525 RepID=A0A6B3L9U5_9BACT|nr:TonB family protein [Sulfuriroseicoccus oceanibius]QQL46325.1 TonB family protein [Sulfuriroseicoccus oceanibius]